MTRSKHNNIGKSGEIFCRCVIRKLSHDLSWAILDKSAAVNFQRLQSVLALWAHTI